MVAKGTGRPELCKCLRQHMDVTDKWCCGSVCVICVRACVRVVRAKNVLGVTQGQAVDVVCALWTKIAKRNSRLLRAFPASCEQLGIFADITPSDSRDANQSTFFQAQTNEETATVVIVRHPPNPMVLRGKRLTDSPPSLHPCVTTPLCHLSIEESVTPEVGRYDSRRCCLQRKKKRVGPPMLNENR